MNKEHEERVYFVRFPSIYDGMTRNLFRDWNRAEMDLHIKAWNLHPGWFTHVNPILEVDGHHEEILKDFTIEDIDDLYDSMVFVEDGRP